MELTYRNWSSTFDGGAVHYFLRLQCLHLHEGMKIIEELKASPDLRAKTEECGPEMKAAFFDVIECCRGGKDRAKFEQLQSRIRHTLTFHYAAKDVEKAIRRLAHLARQQKPALAPNGLVTLGMDIGLPRFVIADSITTQILVGRIIGVQQEKEDAAAVLEDARVFINQKCRNFLHFVGEFAVRYLREFALSR